MKERGYDPRNAVVSVVNPTGFRLTYTYDALGKRSFLLDPSGRQIDYYYDIGGRLNALVNTPGSGPAQRSTWSYDPVGHTAENWLGNSTRVSYTYDAAGRLLTLRNLRPDDSILSGFHYLLDATGNRMGVIEANGSRSTWTYDAGYQLIAEHRSGTVSFRITHVYDPAGNRLVHIDNGVRTSYVYDAANQLSTSDASTGRTTYSYDASGNLAVQASPGGRTTNTWDGENHVTRVQLPSGVVNTMAYDADGLRTVKEDTAGITKFVWDGQNVLLETDAGNGVQAAYTLSPARYGKLLDEQRSGVWRYYHFDGIDSTAGLSDTNGQFLDNYVYEAYGSLRSSNGSTVNPFRYVGGLGCYFDADLTQYYVRARHYDPRFARWLSEDPIGYEAADGNLYRYVGNRPLILVDPSGEQAKGRTNQECCDAAEGEGWSLPYNGMLICCDGRIVPCVWFDRYKRNHLGTDSRAQQYIHDCLKRHEGRHFGRLPECAQTCCMGEVKGCYWPDEKAEKEGECEADRDQYACLREKRLLCRSLKCLADMDSEMTRVRASRADHCGGKP